MVRTPDGSGKLELVKYHAPADTNGVHPLPPNRLGFRHICIEVEDRNYEGSLENRKAALVQSARYLKQFIP